jgi:hypothetical protein
VRARGEILRCGANQRWGDDHLRDRWCGSTQACTLQRMGRRFRMTRPNEPTQLELELKLQHTAQEPSPDDDAEAPEIDADPTEDEKPLPSSDEEEFEHEDIWSDPSI